MVDSMKQIFLLKPEVLTPNRNGFMVKKRKWHLKAGSTVHVPMKLSGRNCVILLRTNRLKCALNKKILNLHNQESISGEISGGVSKVDEKPRMIEKVS